MSTDTAPTVPATPAALTPAGGPTTGAPSGPASGTATGPADPAAPEEPEDFEPPASWPDGLTTAEAHRLLQEHGPNEIAEEHKNPLREFLGYFWAPIPWMIETALILSIVVQHWVDVAIIGVLLVVNGVVAFMEEHEAANAIAALKQRLATEARVLRDGVWRTEAVRELVPGDIVRVRLGDVVPADVRALGAGTLDVDQAALTGESLPVERGRGETLYSGSVIVRGETDAVVEGTGANSFFGKTTALVGEAGTVSHLQQAVLKIGNYLILLAVALVTLTVIVSVARGNPVLSVLEFALVVVIASVPVALPAVMSVTLAVGARNLAKRGAVVSNLPAVEELGSIDILCSDKTGTLTENRLAILDPWVPEGVDQDDLLGSAALASRAENGDPIDRIVISTATDRLTDSDTGWAHGLPVTDFVPFDPVTKRTEATVTFGPGPGPAPDSYHVSKGAPQVIARLCDGDPAAAHVARIADEFAARGFRSLGVARTDESGAWRLLGILPLADPPREDTADTVAAANELGVSVKMVTGDQVAISRELARQIGMGDNILNTHALDDSRPEAELAELVEMSDGFAQVFPEHKYRIVKMLQERGHIVGMTGDGVNDAPALKQADAGIAVADATDAARAAADVVLLTPGLSVISHAISQAREIIQRMVNYATYRITETIRVLGLITLTIVAYNFFPVTAMMIVLLALLNDGAILTIAYDKVRGSHKPVTWDMRSVLTLATVLGVVGVAETFLLFVLGREVFHLSDGLIHSLVYLSLSVSGQLTIFVTRTRGRFWTSPTPAKPLVVAVTVAQTIATLVTVFGVGMTPLGWGWAAAVWGYAICCFLLEDQLKLAAHWFLDRRPGVRSVAH
ncbi:plasma-membrane proton-efflux P-type ATPase [Streptomyces sp. NPDC002812]|uniref:plasma-membrane proton-efflux P-type ATPase n=1 Tax=Streptomyces sp. NPDC002812 TaxID=3154434 RepID=UPI003329904F